MDIWKLTWTARLRFNNLGYLSTDDRLKGYDNMQKFFQASKFNNFIYIFVAAAQQPPNRLGNINLPRMKHKVLRPFIPGVIVYW